MPKNIMNADFNEAIFIARSIIQTINDDSLEAAKQDDLALARSLFDEMANLTRYVTGINLRKVITKEERFEIKRTAKHCFKLSAKLRQ